MARGCGHTGPLTKLSQIDALRPVLTEWIRSLHAVAAAAEAAQGRRKRLYVRVPAADEGVWRQLGLDVAG